MYKIIQQEKKDHFFEVKVNVSGKEWTDEVAKQKTNAIKNLSIPGFRKGKIPTNKAEKLINIFEVFEKAANHILDPVLQKIFNEKTINDEELIGDSPGIEIVDVNDKELTFLAKFELIPTIDLPNYKQIPEISNPENINDNQVEEQIKKMLKDEAEVIAKSDEIVAEGNIVIIDFKGTVDGKVLDSTTANDYELEIGSNSFIPGFESGLIGLKKDETKILELKFPKDYHQADFADKPVSFEVKIKGIKEVKYPQLDNNNLKDIIGKHLNPKDVENIKTIDQFRVFIKERLQENAKNQSKKSNHEKIRNFLIENTKYSHIPEAMVNGQKRRLQYELNKQLEQYQIKIEDFLKIQGLEKKDFEANIHKEAVQNIKYILAIEEISEKEKIEVSSQEIDQEIQKYINEFAKDEKDIKNLDQIKKRLSSQPELFETIILNDKVVDFLIKTNIK